MNDSPDPQDPTPTQIERAMTGYLPQYQVAALLGVTGSAVSNRPAAFRREQGGIRVPGGWLYAIERLAQGGWVPAELLPAVPTYKMAMPTPEAIERTLSGYLTQGQVSAALGISRAAITKRADWIKREMGGALTPNGWLFEPGRLQAYAPLRGRPTEERRAAAPAPDVDSMPQPIDKSVAPVYTPLMNTTATPKTPKTTDPDDITTPVLSVRLPSLELRKAVTEKCRAEGTSVAAFIAMVCEALVDGRLRIIEPAPPAKPSFLIPADSPDPTD